MATYRFFAIFLLLILAQNALAKPIDDTGNLFDSEEEEEIRKNPTPLQKLLLYTIDNFILLGKNFASNAANVSRHILKDEALMANTKPEVMEFKKNLTMFVEEYDTAKSPLVMWDILDIYSNTTEYFMELPANKITPESEFVKNILNKYNCRAVVVKFGTEFTNFMENFVKLFEENKAKLDKSALDWYEKYSALKDIDDKIDAFGGFIEMA